MTIVSLEPPRTYKRRQAQRASHRLFRIAVLSARENAIFHHCSGGYRSDRAHLGGSDQDLVSDHGAFEYRPDKCEVF